MNKTQKALSLSTFAALASLLIGCASSPATVTPAASPDANDQATAAVPAERSDIVVTAVEAGSFNTLVAAVKAADMVDVLKGDGPFTVFAPTDDAFAKLPPGTVEDLLKPENKDKLQAVLKYHVVSGRVDAQKVVTMNEAETVQGSMLRIQTEGESVMVNDANVIKADVQCSNGIIHVIDTVVLPAT